MADFNNAVATLLKHEGGFQDNPSDIGNYDNMGNLIGTNFGITPKTYYSFYRRWPTRNDMKAMFALDAMQIYRVLYWDKYRLSSIPDQAVSDQILDTLVLHGRGAELIQLTANEMNYKIPINNIYDSVTGATVNDLSSNPRTATKFNDALVNTRINYVTGLAENNPEWYQFLPGWKKRIMNFWSGTKPLKIAGVAILVGVGLLATFPELRRFLRIPF